MFKCEIELLKNLTEEELHKYFGKYIPVSIVLFVIISLYIESIIVPLSFMARLFILIMAFAITIMIWTFNLLVARLQCRSKSIPV